MLSGLRERAAQLAAQKAAQLAAQQAAQSGGHQYNQGFLVPKPVPPVPKPKPKPPKPKLRGNGNSQEVIDMMAGNSSLIVINCFNIHVFLNEFQGKALTLGGYFLGFGKLFQIFYLEI